MTTYLYEAPAPQLGQRLAREWRRAEAMGITIDQALGAQDDDARRLSKAAHKRLGAGDTLVVSSVGALGASYAEISDAIRDLMRRRISLRSIDENLTFNGAIQDCGAQASRDALIAFAAAAAAVAKSAQRAAEQGQARLLEAKALEDGDRESNPTVPQLGVIAAQLGALALAAYLFTATDTNRSEPAPPSAQVHEHAQNTEPAREPPLYASKDFLSEIKPPAPGTKSEAAASPSSRAPGELAGEQGDEEKSNIARQDFQLSRERELAVFAAVGDWRSAKLKGNALPIEVGAHVPPNVRLSTFPRRLVRQEPKLGGYKFIVAGRRILVVEPAARQVVAVFGGPTV
ncbi:DUF1236 domain-containing protein [Methylocystis echinoides]|uniref:DUF1236 domain-containing protein n=1 Tax=Methylocystis echinoides TaxID=29468 RepID=UPI003435046F